MKALCHEMHVLLVARRQFQAGCRCFHRDRQVEGRTFPNNCRVFIDGFNFHTEKKEKRS